MWATANPMQPENGLVDRMENEELLNFIIRGLNQDRKLRIMRVLPDMVSSCPEFRNLVGNYKDKIHTRKFLEPTTEEVFNDNFFELLMGYQLIQNFSSQIINFEYEKYKKESGPDFTITFLDGFVLNVEVKRIREYPLERAFNDLCSYLTRELDSLTGAINVDLTLEQFNNRNDLCLASNLDSFQYRERLRELIRQHLCQANLTSDVAKGNEVFIHDNLIRVCISPASGTGYIINSFTNAPIPFYDDAKDKIAEKIRDAMGQIVPNEANFIILGTLNLCYDKCNFDVAVRLLQDEYQGGSKFQYLNGILFKCWGSPFYAWFNADEATRLPVNIKKNLQFIPRLNQPASG